MGDADRIDFVVTWVNGSDPAWLAERHRYENGSTRGQLAGGEANAECRYRDNGLLRYWFRAAEKFAPWVNHVFFVTCGQKPDWLDESNPKLKLVRHADYIPAEYLPTFHSDTIELNLHRLKDLSEHFVLFNDDMFILRRLKPTHFFRNGLPVLDCDLGIPRWLGWSTAGRVVVNNSGALKQSLDVERLVWKNILKFVNVRSLGLGRAAKNLLSFAINRVYIPGTFGHVGLPHLKGTFDDIWSAQPALLDMTSRSRFRIDCGVSHWLACAWNVVNGWFYPTNEKRGGKSTVIDEEHLAQICEDIRRQVCPQLCLNDTEHVKDSRRCTAEIAKAFDSILPDKSTFEK